MDAVGNLRRVKKILPLDFADQLLRLFFIVISACVEASVQAGHKQKHCRGQDREHAESGR